MSSHYCFLPNKPFATSLQQHVKLKEPNELKFKIESVGVQPKDDDDLDMCPARIRPSWPKQIIPWWSASHPNEKPPYSYATLIAHAILASKDGRLTLNDIYTWISKNYSTFSVGNGGWQNSIRHNLSLNKKWFYKIDRRPTQANPGKGCYWALVAGTEHIFIDSLTQEGGGHSRKYHDVALTVELSSKQHRREPRFYNHKVVAPASTRSSFIPLYTTFRMAPKSNDVVSSTFIAELDDSDDDSGVDIGNKYADRDHVKKRRRTHTIAVGNSYAVAKPVIASKQMVHANSQIMVHGSAFEENHETLNNSAKHLLVDTDQQQQINTITPLKRHRSRAINLDDEELTQKYLHFEEGNITNNSRMVGTSFTSLADISFYDLYPSQSLQNTFSYPLALQPQCQLYQFVSMQDILYS